MIFNIIFSIKQLFILLVVILIGCGGSQDRPHKSAMSYEFNICSDKNVYQEERVKMLSMLTVHEKVKLRQVLLSRLSSDQIESSLGDLCVLAEVGDESTAKSIEHLFALDPVGIDVPGKIYAARDFAINRIRARCAAR